MDQRDKTDAFIKSCRERGLNDIPDEIERFKTERELRLLHQNYLAKLKDIQRDPGRAHTRHADMRELDIQLVKSAHDAMDRGRQQHMTQRQQEINRIMEHYEKNSDLILIGNKKLLNDTKLAMRDRIGQWYDQRTKDMVDHQKHAADGKARDDIAKIIRNGVEQHRQRDRQNKELPPAKRMGDQFKTAARTQDRGGRER